MLWFLVLHIVAVLFWCAAQLYVPVLIASLSSENKGRATSSVSEANLPRTLPRFIFTHISTPAALIAIIAGTIVFWMNRTLEVWFIAKLGLVVLLVVTHALSGWLLLYAESQPGPKVEVIAKWLAVVLATLMSAIILLVLAKPLSGLML